MDDIMSIEKGTVKVVWVTKNAKNIYSMMFDDTKEAEKFGRTKKDYLIFRLLWRRKFKSFAWALLPYGNYKLYEAALKLYWKFRGRKQMIERMFRI